MQRLEASVEESKKAEEAKENTTPGTHEIEIRDVIFLDKNRNHAKSYLTHDKMVVKICFHAKQKIPRPIFGVAINHVEGSHMCGPNTTSLARVLREVEGNGDIEFCIESLVLLPGTYLFTVGIFDHISHYPFDYHDKTYKFEVGFGGADGHRGLVAMDYSWNLNPDGKFHLEDKPSK